MKYLSLLLLLFIGCSEKETVEPVYKLENFELVQGSEMELLNSWRQENFDKHIVCFDYVFNNGYVLYWVKNPGNSRQVFVWEPVDSKLWPVEQLNKIKQKYINHEIVSICYRDGYIILLQDKLEPYQPSVQ